MKIRFISLTVILMFLMFGVVHAGTINLPKTGQTKCYDTAGDEIPFPGTGQDGANQAELERGQGTRKGSILYLWRKLIIKKDVRW